MKYSFYVQSLPKEIAEHITNVFDRHSKLSVEVFVADKSSADKIRKRFGGSLMHIAQPSKFSEIYILQGLGLFLFKAGVNTSLGLCTQL